MLCPRQIYGLIFLLTTWIPFLYAQSSPTCTNTYQTLQVTEPSSPNFVVHDFFTAPDCAGAGFTYSILSGDANSRFDIVGTEFQVRASLDAEAKDGSGDYESPYKIVVEVTNGDGLSAYISLLVEVVSENDNAPSITPDSATVSFSESTALGTSITSCDLSDADYPGGLDAAVRVSITAGNDDGNFAINSETCDITLVKALDFETTPSYTLTLEVTDLDPTSPLTNTQDVTVTVTDVNDVSPTCPFYNTITKLDENTSGVLDTIACTDTDALPLVYSKNTGDPSLSVSTSGEISLASPGPDYDSGDRNLEIAVLITDQGNPILSTTVTYSLSVADIDDNVPVFSPDHYAETISESVNLGQEVLTLTATDADEANTDNSKITFGFETPCTQDWFALDASTGVLVVKTAPDFATASSVTCQVFAYSSTESASKNLATITITIEETNSNAPIFTMTLYTGSVSESDPVGTSVLTVTATDADSGINGDVQYSLGTTSHFTIDAVSGELTIDTAVNYEADVQHLVLVRATDQGSPAQSAETYVSITVDPVNEFDPVIPAISDQTVAETATPGTLLTTVAATDDDAGDDGEIELSLADTSLPFIVEPDTGALRVGLGLDHESQATYDVVVVATDKSATTQRSSSSTVTVTVTDVNDNSPNCNILGPLVVTPTTVNIGNPIGMLVCTDGDSSSTLSYTESGGDPNTIFQVDPNNGEIRLVTAFVYGSYSYLVTVSDGGSPAKTTLFPVEILVEADLSFAVLPDTHQVSENVAISDVLYNVSALGAYDLVTYSIVAGNDAGKFSIHPSLGQVRLVSELDRETQDSYTLTVRATSTNGQTLDETLTITVTDVNDNTPEFANSFTNISFVENVGIPQTLASLPATDRDLGINALIDYTIASGNDAGAFTIDANGNLMLTSPVDYETNQYFDLVITATDRGTPALTGTTQAYVVVENVDDNAIKVSPTTGVVSLSLVEDVAIGTTAVQVDAIDADLGTELSYSITFGNDAGDFSVNPNTGAVYVALPLDRETEPTYTIGVEVNSTQGESATVTLSITVTDVNDNDPQFTIDNYVFEMPHGTAADTDVGTLTVTDNDATSPNNQVTLSIESGDDNNHFTFDGQVLKTATTLDANSENLYNLVVKAEDGGSPARSSIGYVTVHVAAEFQTPSFVPDTAEISVEETRVPGSILFDSDATAAGAQETPAGDLQYSIASGNDAGTFYVEEYTGAVQLLQPLNYSVTTSYSLAILAVNKYEPNTLSDTFTLTITVTQVNRYDPVFSEDTYSWTVSEDASIGTSVGTVVATDADPGAYGTISFALEPTAVFNVDSTSGVVTLASTLEYSEAKSYDMYVTAIDDAGNSSRTASVALVITITDVNNHAPTFSGSPYSIMLPETLTTGTSFFVTKAEDLDSGAFGTITYSIADGNSDNRFAIDSNTATLSLIAALDYETTTQYNLTIHASDGGSPSLTGTATVTVDVLDMNDNAPDFGESRLDLQIGTDLAALSTVTTLTATDADSSGSDGEFNYVIESGNDAGLFSIDTTTGEIKTTQAVSADAGFYDIVVIAVDQGLPQLTGTVTVGISIQLVTSPITGDYEFSVSENEAAGTAVGTIPRDASLTITSYSITGGNYDSSFAISTSAGQEGVIATAKELDRETYAYYQLQVDVNHSTGVKSITVTIEVTDDNDNAPEPSTNPIDITMVENLPVGDVIGTVSATDADDSGVNSELSYALSSSTPLGSVFFSVDASSGAISIAREVSYERYASLSFQVLVSDAGSPSLTSTVTVDVTVADVDETITYTEMPTTSLIPVEFPYDLGHREVAYTLSPSDFGVTTASGDTITYKTINYGVFEIDSSTGAMSLYLPERVREVTSVLQWVIMTVRSGATTSAYAGLVRLDSFNRDKHLIAVVSGTDETDLSSQQSTLETHLQTFYSSPNLIKVWKTEAVAEALARRRLLASGSVALAVVLADSSSDTFDQIDQFKTFLDQDAALVPLRSSSDGTPASNVSGQPVDVTSVLAFVTGERPVDDDDDDDDDSLDVAIIALIVVAAIAALTVLAGVLVLSYYCCTCCERRRRRWREDRNRLIDDIKKEQTKKRFVPLDEEPVSEEEEDEDDDEDKIEDEKPTGERLKKKRFTMIEEGDETDEEEDEPDEPGRYLAPSPDYKAKFQYDVEDGHQETASTVVNENKDDNPTKSEESSRSSLQSSPNLRKISGTSIADANQRKISGLSVADRNQRKISGSSIADTNVRKISATSVGYTADPLKQQLPAEDSKPAVNMEAVGWEKKGESTSLGSRSKRTSRSSTHLKPPGAPPNGSSRDNSPSRPKKVSVSPAPKRRVGLVVPPASPRVRKVSPAPVAQPVPPKLDPEADGEPSSGTNLQLPSTKIIISRAETPPQY